MPFIVGDPDADRRVAVVRISGASFAAINNEGGGVYTLLLTTRINFDLCSFSRGARLLMGSVNGFIVSDDNGASWWFIWVWEVL